jgi:hypothetical protein
MAGCGYFYCAVGRQLERQEAAGVAFLGSRSAAVSAEARQMARVNHGCPSHLASEVQRPRPPEPWMATVDAPPFVHGRRRLRPQCACRTDGTLADLGRSRRSLDAVGGRMPLFEMLVWSPKQGRRVRPQAIQNPPGQPNPSLAQASRLLLSTPPRNPFLSPSPHAPIYYPWSSPSTLPTHAVGTMFPILRLLPLHISSPESSTPRTAQLPSIPTQPPK